MLNANQRFSNGDILVRDLEVSTGGPVNCIFYCSIDENTDGVETEWCNETESEILIHTFTDVITSEDVKWGLHVFTPVDKFLEQYAGYTYLNKQYDFMDKISKVCEGECSDMDMVIPISRMRAINDVIDYARAFVGLTKSKYYVQKIPDSSVEKIIDIANLNKFNLPSPELVAIGRASYNKKMREQGVFF